MSDFSKISEEEKMEKEETKQILEQLLDSF